MDIKKHLVILCLLATVQCAFTADNFTLGVNAYNAKQYQQSQQYLTSAVSQYPNNVNIRYWYCLALIKNKDIDAARTNYKYIIAQSPNSQEARYSRQGLAMLDEYVSKNTSLSLKYKEDNYIKNMYRDGILYRWKPGAIRVYVQPGANQALVKKAFKEWESKTSQAVTFIFDDSPKYAKIKITFVDKLEKNVYDGKFKAGNCAYQFEGKYMSGAQISVLTVAPTGQRLPSAMLYRTLLHEIGHSIGLLGHSTNPYDVMATAEKNTVNTLSQRDINTVLLLYKGYLNHDQKTQHAAKTNEYSDFASKVPSNPQSWIDLGNSHFLAKQYSSAVASYQKAVNLGSKDINMFINMSAAYYYLANYSNAEIAIKKALAVDGSNPRAMSNLLVIYDKTSKNDLAKAELTRYLGLYPNKRYDKTIEPFVKNYGL